MKVAPLIKQAFKYISLGIIVFPMMSMLGMAAQQKPLKVGVTAGPHAIIMEKIKEVAKNQGLDIKIIEFNDFIMPNTALNEGSLDVNSYQHEPYMKNQMQTRGYQFVNVGKTILLPMGIYSKKHKSLKDIKNGMTISIPNDPTNGSRALLLLEKAGLIKLKSTDLPGLFDIKENPTKLKFIEIEAPQLPRALEDVDFGVINTDWVVLAGQDPKSALFNEVIDSPYTNILVVRKGDENREEIKKLVKIYQSDEIAQIIKEHFKGAILPGWK